MAFLTGNLQRLGEVLLPDAARPGAPKPGTRRGFTLGLLPAVVLTYAADEGRGVAQVGVLAGAWHEPQDAARAVGAGVQRRTKGFAGL